MAVLVFCFFFAKLIYTTQDCLFKCERKMNSNDLNDITIKTISEKKELPHSELTRIILGCCSNEEWFDLEGVVEDEQLHF
jgi:hypothetical protein